MKQSKVLGIDYSVQCPALCLLDTDSTTWWVNYKLHGKPYKDIPSVQWTTSTTDGEVPRFLELAHWVSNVIQMTAPTLIVLEDYAFGASGRLTQLSENVGVLKARLHEYYPHIPLRVVAPTTMKKFATGRGIATKDDIWAAFIKREPHAAAWATICHPKASRITSPVADIADAYFLAHYGHTHFLQA